MGKQVAGRHLTLLRTHFVVFTLYSAAVTKQPHTDLYLLYVGEKYQTTIEVQSCLGVLGPSQVQPLRFLLCDPPAQCQVSFSEFNFFPRCLYKNVLMITCYPQSPGGKVQLHSNLDYFVSTVEHHY